MKFEFDFQYPYIHKDRFCIHLHVDATVHLTSQTYWEPEYCEVIINSIHDRIGKRNYCDILSERDTLLIESAAIEKARNSRY